MPTDLYRSLSQRDSLLAAWSGVRRGGRAPGLDGVYLEQFAFHLDREISRLSQELRDGTYHPWPARGVDIPKPAGGIRHIGIQAVRDRVVQRSLLELAQPRIEPLLEEASFAFRPGRSVERALTTMAGWRDRGYPWVVHSDVRLCFDSLDRRRLDESLATVVPEEDVRRLVATWLSAGTVDERGWRDTGEGVRQGDVLSPLLCNLYLDPFDERVLHSGAPLVRYADDFVIMSRTAKEAQARLADARAALGALDLQLNEEKTEIRSFIQGFQFLGAAVAGSLMLPLYSIDRPGRPPRFTFGYGPPRTAHVEHRQRRLASTRSELVDLMVSLLRQEHQGRVLPAMASAMLRAWRDAGRIPPERSGPEEWDSVFLI